MKNFLRLTAVVFLIATSMILTGCPKNTTYKNFRPTWTLQWGNPAVVVVENNIRSHLVLEIDGFPFFDISAFQRNSGNIERHEKEKKYIFSVKILGGRSFSKILSVRPGDRILISVFKNKRREVEVSFKRN